MAVPTVQQRTPSTSKIPTWVSRLGSSAGRPLFAVLLAMIAGSIVIMMTASGGFDQRFATVINAFQSLYIGSLGDPQSLSFTLVRVGPLIFAGLSVAIAFRAGLFNIGAGGQLAVGAMTACIIGLKAPMLPGWFLVPLMILSSMLAGAIWGGIVGFLKAWRGAHEVVTTIMLNWIAFFVCDYLINGPFKDLTQANQTSALPPHATLPRLTDVYNATLGNFLPKVDPFIYPVDVTILISLLALVVYWFITKRTTFGYEIRVIGQNAKAALNAGIPVKRNIFFAMALAGAFAGLAGSLRLMGQFPYYLIGSTFSLDPTGFDAIGVALLGQISSVGVFLGALLFGSLRQGGSFMQISAGIPGDLVFIIQALVLFSIASEFWPAIRRALPKRWLNIGGRTVLATESTENVPETSNGANKEHEKQSAPPPEARTGSSRGEEN